jgi:hypothetical protein
VYHADSAIEGQKNLDKIHAKPESHSDAECMACHGEMKASKPASGTSNVKIDVHFHLTLTVASFHCADCHHTGRVWYGTQTGSNTKMIRINRFFCFNCHGPFDKYVQKGSMKAEYKTLDCQMCHRGKMAPKHAQPFLNQVLSSSECLMCHGNNLFPWPKQHYTTAWKTQHGLYAGDRKVCATCHNIAVFCKTCHTVKPPTHDQNWRGVHKMLYRQNPARCGTCHTADFCNTKCHLVNHTANWRQNHGGYVRDNGRDLCMKCHYLGFCLGCHNSVAPQKITF